MPILDVRELLSYKIGNNASDTVIGDIHFNLTTLEHFNYTLYSNGTLSNGSKCFLTFEPYTPTLLYANGTFINTTSCYSPINDIGPRSKTGIGFAVCFGVLLVLNLVNINKHGRLLLPAEKRFQPIGRRWQWYWGCITCAMALVSLFTNIDVDRYYLPELPIVLTSFFWFLTEMCTLAIVWEAVRHWGSWMERQYIDPDPFALPEDGRRYHFELLIPLVFYLFLWMNFFLVVPRSWGNIEKQRSDEQAAQYAIPDATDARFKAAAFFLLAAWVIIIISLRHSIRHYMPRNRGMFNRRGVNMLGSTPLRFLLLLPISLGMVAYQALCSFDFDDSVLKVKGNPVSIFVGGYLPSLLILFIQALYGWIVPNEDRELIRQRHLRGIEQDRELGIVHKPAWWHPAKYQEGSMRDIIARNVNEIRGVGAPAGHQDSHELNDFSGPPLGRRGSFASMRTTASAARSFQTYEGKSDRRRYERTMQAIASLLFPGSEPKPDRTAELMLDGPPPPYRDGESSLASSTTAARTPTLTRTNSTITNNSINGPAQEVRSMLDL